MINGIDGMMKDFSKPEQLEHLHIAFIIITDLCIELVKNTTIILATIAKQCDCL